MCVYNPYIDIHTHTHTCVCRIHTYTSTHKHTCIHTTHSNNIFDSLDTVESTCLCVYVCMHASSSHMHNPPRYSCMYMHSLPSSIHIRMWLRLVGSHIGLFCKRALQKRLYSAKETYILKEHTNHSHIILILHPYICA